jgi:DNA-binding CsgD family transcriptional regulator
LKSDAGKDLVNAVDAVQHNGTVFNPRMAQALGSDLRGSYRTQDKDVLTCRERQVVQLLAEGQSTKEVATALNFSVKTAETHRSKITSKLGLHSISELILYAVRSNMVQAISTESLTRTASPEANTPSSDYSCGLRYWKATMTVFTPRPFQHIKGSVQRLP